jgi:hypothetical protein
MDWAVCDICLFSGYDARLDHQFGRCGAGHYGHNVDVCLEDAELTELLHLLKPLPLHRVLVAMCVLPHLHHNVVPWGMSIWDPLVILPRSHRPGRKVSTRLLYWSGYAAPKQPLATRLSTWTHSPWDLHIVLALVRLESSHWHVRPAHLIEGEQRKRNLWRCRNPVPSF